MTLRDLLIKCSYKKTFNQIYKFYLKGQYEDSEITEFDCLYYNLFKKLISLPEKLDPNSKIYLANINGEEPEIDVCFLDKNKDELFAMDFIDWGDIIDLEIYTTFESTDEEYLAHILYEITFWGFDQETINKQAKNDSD